MRTQHNEYKTLGAYADNLTSLEADTLRSFAPSIFADADSLLSGFSGKLAYNVKTSSPTGKAMINEANWLESYNDLP